ncbi:Laccase [Handroanthus impetiginosus]|uniref:Laccase n=1 Tax=Handroanthus impetiginosus TaxID=429701 RepID=A0A2G9GNI5_9LAMI|nr:Laccase [Handroanthus impetiginosus]
MKLDTFKLTVDYGKAYLLRMANAVTNNIMFLRIANHKFTIVGSDGSYTKPFTGDYIAIPLGQTIDFLPEANQQPSHYYMAAQVYAIAGTSDNTTTAAIVEYSGNYSAPSFPLLPTLPYFFTLFINTFPCPPDAPYQGARGGRFRASVNNITFVPPRVAILGAYYNPIRGIYGDNFPKVRVLEYNSVVEIVFEGTNVVARIYHPMHLHGYSFYVVGSGSRNFEKDRDPLNYNLVDPPFQNTIVVPVNGWTTIRFKANNPGVWLMHCDLEHTTWGMEMAFIVKNGKGSDAKMLPPPPDMPRC